MPASLPGDTLANNLANPNAGTPVIYDPLSGPKGSPFDNDKDVTTGTARGGCSTGALSTGIGFGPSAVFQAGQQAAVANFHDDYTPGVTKPDTTASADSTLMYIGGGRCNANSGGMATPVPYTAGFAIGGAGNGGSRDAGAGPAHTAFGMKYVTAAAGVAAGAVVETGFVNRSGVALVTGQSVFGSASTAGAAPTETEEPPAEEPPPEEPPVA